MGKANKGGWLAFFFLRFGGFLLLVRVSLWFFFPLFVAECIGLNWLCWEAGGCCGRAGAEAAVAARVAAVQRQHQRGCTYSRCSASSPSRDFHCLLPQDCFLNSLLRGPAFPPPLSRSRATSALLASRCLALSPPPQVPAPGDMPHRAPRRVCPGCTCTRRYS